MVDRKTTATATRNAGTVPRCPWVLVGPWYRWSQPGVPASGRLSRPIFQKYETSDFVNEFLKNPQRSLRFLDEDRIQDTTGQPTSHAGGTGLPGAPSVLKLFLDTHKRFYLVVCELHCDVAGFPVARRQEACEAGFVVRRRIAQIPKSATKAAAEQLARLARAQSAIERLNELLPGQKSAMVEAAEQGYLERYAEADATFRAWAAANRVKLLLQGWVPTGAEHVGCWETVEETPRSIKERVFPLYPLVADPTLSKHAGKDRAIYFGVLPTSSADSDETGFAHLDDQNLYEVRCFVRQHDPLCPRKQTRGDCQGPIVWSRRTVSYRLASHFDLTGTSNRPVTIQLPDLRALEAQAAALPPGKGAPVKMVAPPGSNLSFRVDTTNLKATRTGAPTAAICSFSIPLITIVANFVFRLFLPVVTFLFGLFFLLKLRFCIPPTVGLSAAVAAKLNTPADFDTNPVLQQALVADIKTAFGQTEGGQIAAQYTPSEQAALMGRLATDFSGDLPAGIQADAASPNAPEDHLVPVTANLVYEQEVDLP